MADADPEPLRRLSFMPSAQAAAALYHDPFTVLSSHSSYIPPVHEPLHCPGVEFTWPHVQFWSTHPFQRHGFTEPRLGYQFASIVESSDGRNVDFRIRSDSCQRTNATGPCSACEAVKSTVTRLAEMAVHAEPRTSHKYLSHDQVRGLVEERDTTINALKLKLNLGRKVASVMRKLDDYRRFVMAVSTGDVPRLRQLVMTPNFKRKSHERTWRVHDYSSAVKPKIYSSSDVIDSDAFLTNNLFATLIRCDHTVSLAILKCIAITQNGIRVGRVNVNSLPHAAAKIHLTGQILDFRITPSAASESTASAAWTWSGAFTKMTPLGNGPIPVGKTARKLVSIRLWELVKAVAGIKSLPHFHANDEFPYINKVTGRAGFQSKDGSQYLEAHSQPSGSTSFECYQCGRVLLDSKKARRVLISVSTYCKQCAGFQKIFWSIHSTSMSDTDNDDTTSMASTVLPCTVEEIMSMPPQEVVARTASMSKTASKTADEADIIEEPEVDRGEGQAGARQIVTCLSIFSAAEMLKAKTKREAVNTYMHLASDEPFDTWCAQLLVKVDAACQSKTLDFKNYNVKFSIPRISREPLPVKTTDNYAIMISRASNSRKAVPICVVLEEHSAPVSRKKASQAADASDTKNDITLVDDNEESGAPMKTKTKKDNSKKKTKVPKDADIDPAALCLTGYCFIDPAKPGAPHFGPGAKQFEVWSAVMMIRQPLSALQTNHKYFNGLSDEAKGEPSLLQRRLQDTLNKSSKAAEPPLPVTAPAQQPANVYNFLVLGLRLVLLYRRHLTTSQCSYSLRISTPASA
ncbi:hypothetical protein FA95DRAFT_1577424 [Auriscalpium vulgare]|uniref:Uncharacterized protein n=1 Tax=Auriscalpium vulgare TaxID=40419 RepID=A0ACB8R6N1_9AGAM|nr:hypothetical protein FA95DRAFT_1577424 [Auriscalpium vulgare]